MAREQKQYHRTSRMKAISAVVYGIRDETSTITLEKWKNTKQNEEQYNCNEK